MNGIRILCAGLVSKKAFHAQSVRLLGILVGYFFLEMVYALFNQSEDFHDFLIIPMATEIRLKFVSFLTHRIWTS